ncbi:MAG: MFS transporter, partial [Nocardioidaceae bacterium]
ATTMLMRAFLAYVMAGALHDLWLYPAAFGCLAMSKAYGVARSATVPRLLPPRVTLVAANARLSLATIVAAAVFAVLGAGLSRLGTAWPLRLAVVVYVFGMVLALRLPAKADSDTGERTARLPGWSRRQQGWLRGPSGGRARLRGPSGVRGWLRGRGGGQTVLLTRPVTVALTASASLRALSGFLTLYLAFLLRTTANNGLRSTVALGAVIVAASVGSFVGTSIGARLRLGRPQPLQLGLIVLAAAGCVLAAVFSVLVTAVAVALLAGTTNSLAKLALDSVIQTEVAESVRSSAFARSETLLQLSWVVGGALGLIPFGGWPGFVVAAVGLVAVAVRTAWSLRGLRADRQTTQPAAPSSPAGSPGVSADAV